MLDTLAKRLNFLGYPAGAALTEGDSHALLGLMPPERILGGAILATLGAVTVSMVGTFTAPPPAAWGSADRSHALGLAYGINGLDVYEQYQQLGFFLFQGSGAVGGRINATTGAVVASLRGTNASSHVDGRIASTLGPAVASLRGEAYYDCFFDVDYSITPAFTPTVLTANLGAISAALGDTTVALRGQALPPNSSNGQILASLDPTVASFSGTFVPAAARDGKLKLDLQPATVGMRGVSVPPSSFIGAIIATLEPVTASLRGSTAVPMADGRLEVTLGAVTANFYGQALLPGTIYGLINAPLQSVSASLRGTGAPPAVLGPSGRIAVGQHPKRSINGKRPRRG